MSCSLCEKRPTCKELCTRVAVLLKDHLKQKSGVYLAMVDNKCLDGMAINRAMKLRHGKKNSIEPLDEENIWD